METEKNKKELLVEFLKKKVFEPILTTPDNKYSSRLYTDLLHDLQDDMLSEQDRIERYRSAQEVKKNYLAQLHSTDFKVLNKELQELNLPRLSDCKKEFLELCEQLHV